jgi:hypothetical protein
VTIGRLLLLVAVAWVASACPAAIATWRLDRHRAAVLLVLALGPAAVVALALCRRHHETAVLDAASRFLRV